MLIFEEGNIDLNKQKTKIELKKGYLSGGFRFPLLEINYTNY